MSLKYLINPEKVTCCNVSFGFPQDRLIIKAHLYHVEKFCVCDAGGLKETDMSADERSSKSFLLTSIPKT